MEQQRLFRLAFEAINVAGHYVPGRGWSVTIVMRRGDQTWEEADRATYDRLASVELPDVLAAHVAHRLGL